MNKKFLTIAAVAITALVAFGVMTSDQGDKAEGVIAQLESTTDGSMLSGITNAVQDGLSSTMDAAQELASDAESMADQAMDDLAETSTDAMDSMENQIEPASGDADEMKNDMTDKMSN